MSKLKVCTVEVLFQGSMQRFRDGASYWTLPAGARAEVNGMPSRLYGGEGRHALRLRLPEKWYKLAGRALPVGRWRFELLGREAPDGFHARTGPQAVRIVRADAPAQATRSYSPAWHGIRTRVDGVDPELDKLERRKQRLPTRKATKRPRRAVYRGRRPVATSPGEQR